METPTAKHFQIHQRGIHRMFEFTQSNALLTSTLEAIKIRHDRLVELWDKSNDLYLIIQGEAEANHTQAYQDRMDLMEQEYFKALEIFRNRMNELSPGRNESGAANESGSEGVAQKLTLTMPIQQANIQNTWGEFDGKDLNWLGFRDRFIAAVHDNKDIDDSYKLQYLLKSLTGPAKDVLGKGQLPKDSYLDAWERLLELYNRPYRIAQRVMQRFIALPHLDKKPTAADLQHMANLTHDTIRQLRALEYPVDQWDFVIVSRLHDRLDTETATLWNKERTSDYPTAKEMLKFLDKEANAISSSTNWKEEAGKRSWYHNSSDRQQHSSDKHNHSWERRYASLDKPKEKPTSSSFSVAPNLRIKNTGAAPKKYPCEACPEGSNEFHPLYHCPSFVSLNLNARRKFLQFRKICPNCLRKGHTSSQCEAVQCGYPQCRGDSAHNSLLCPHKQSSAVSTATCSRKRGAHTEKLELLKEQEEMLLDQIKDVQNKKRKLTCSSKGVNKDNKNRKVSDNYLNVFNLSIRKKEAFMPTIVVNLENNGIVLEKIRGFLDTGAQPNLITYELYRRHKMVASPTTTKVIGIAGVAFEIRKKVNLRIRPWFDSAPNKFLDIVCWVLPKGSSWDSIMPSNSIKPSKELNRGGVPYADPTFWISAETHILFGITFFAKIIVSVMQKGMDGIALMETLYGIIAFGTETVFDEETEQTVSSISYKEEDQLDKLLERLWIQDEIKPCPKWTEEEIAVERHFSKTFQRDPTGRFIAKIPLKNSVSDIGNTRRIALKRFMFMEKRLERNSEMREIYIGKMREAIQIGHLVLATEKPKENDLVYYIPHHIIPKNNRIVYDASCKSDKGISLNDIQLLGPKLQRNLEDIILRFRRHKVAIYADICKMFNQVRLAREQWNLQRIFWREGKHQPLKEYWLTVIIFGMTASPFIAIRSVIQAAREAKKQFPIAAKVIEEDFYMDDCVSGADSVRSVIKLAKDMNRILKGAGFELRQWKSNRKLLIKSMQSETEDTVLFSEAEGTTILGLKWLVEQDKFTFVVRNQGMDEQVTKRKVVSHVAQLYDPNGYISPVTIKGRIIIQRLWKEKVGWDESLSEETLKEWMEFWKTISHLENIKIDRWLGSENGSKIQVHGFSDSSESALGAAIYVRVKATDGKISCKLLTSKSKVAPLKTVTIPRLELSAAELLARLMKKVKDSMEWPTAEYLYWIDSSVVYHWIRKVPRDLKTYVGNRVASIQNNSEVSCWRHVNGMDNPADLVTRGISPMELVRNKLWFNGPEWLLLDSSLWPRTRVEDLPPVELVEEMRVNTLTKFKDCLCIGLEGQRKNVPLLDYAGKLEKLINIISYCGRFINIWLGKSKEKQKRNRRGELRKIIAPPTNEEKAVAMNYLLRKSQQKHYNQEITAFSNGRGLPNKSGLEPLKPILDKQGLLRVGGRLDRSELDYEMKHPVIVANGSRLAALIVEQAHRRTKHGGVQVMTQYIRQTYWIPKIRNELRKHIHKCVTCARLSAITGGQLMADLPGERTTVGKPFLQTGVDYAGPFEVKFKDMDKPFRKCWIAVFVCFKTRAVHIEIVTDLSTIAFIAAFERFISRRGRCEKMFSDNGTSFVGMDKELRKAIKYWTGKEMLDHLHAKGTEWHFMAPAAPHQGGIYEAAVKSMKFHLKRIAGQKTLPYEQLETLLTQIEAILNSRPLHPLSDDPSDMQALTPGHFLVGEPLITPLPFQIDPKPDTRGVRLWRDRQQMVKHFWNRWKDEYLTTLQERKKWRREKEGIRVGQLVLIKTENFPPTSWALGRIRELVPSKDGLIRTAVVETTTSILKRPIQKLCILPVE